MSGTGSKQSLSKEDYVASPDPIVEEGSESEDSDCVEVLSDQTGTHTIKAFRPENLYEEACCINEDARSVATRNLPMLQTHVESGSHLRFSDDG